MILPKTSEVAAARGVVVPHDDADTAHGIDASLQPAGVSADAGAVRVGVPADGALDLRSGPVAGAVPREAGALSSAIAAYQASEWAPMGGGA